MVIRTAPYNMHHDLTTILYTSPSFTDIFLMHKTKLAMKLKESVYKVGLEIKLAILWDLLDTDPRKRNDTKHD